MCRLTPFTCGGSFERMFFMHGKRWRMCYKHIRKLYGCRFVKICFELNEFNPYFMINPF